MANVKISDLTAATGLAGSDVIEIDTGSVSRKASGNILGAGWIADGNTWAYSSADAPTFVASVNANMTSVLSPGMRVKLTQTTVKYFLVTAVGSYSGGATLITLYGGTDYTLANAAISSPAYSSVKAPFGFPLNPAKWTVSLLCGAAYGEIGDQVIDNSVTDTWRKIYRFLANTGNQVGVGDWDAVSTTGLPVDNHDHLTIGQTYGIQTEQITVTDKHTVDTTYTIDVTRGVNGTAVALHFQGVPINTVIDTYIDLPIGAWDVWVQGNAGPSANTGGTDQYTTLSSAADSETNPEITVFNNVDVTNTYADVPFSSRTALLLAAKTRFYLLAKQNDGATGAILQVSMTVVPFIVRATCAYL